ncbi:hypothetical protein [Bartonella sp. CB178]|uniref:hypothetical protein n=1 Tax=Bartonella sp. CB178 TaxID=3112255 RepID=UPI00300E30B4
MTYNVTASSREKGKLLRQSYPLSLHSLHDAVIKLACFKYTPPATLNTHYLVNLLICQTTRSRRLAIPPVRIHLRVVSQTGDGVPIKIRLGATNT